MEGFWTVQFTGIQGWGAGVVTLVNGQVLGGDSGFMYIGPYTEKGNTMNAKIHVKQHVAGVWNVDGPTPPRTTRHHSSDSPGRGPRVGHGQRSVETSLCR